MGKPTAQQTAEQLISGYKLSQLHLVTVEENAARVTFFTDLQTPGNNIQFQMTVREVWVKRKGQCVIRAYSATLMK
jgi:hypothetical protein